MPSSLGQEQLMQTIPSSTPASAMTEKILLAWLSSQDHLFWIPGEAGVKRNVRRCLDLRRLGWEGRLGGLSVKMRPNETKNASRRSKSLVEVSLRPGDMKKEKMVSS